MLYYNLTETDEPLKQDGALVTGECRVVRGRDDEPDLIEGVPNKRKWMVPAKATLVAPPSEVPEGKCAVYSGDRWQGEWTLVDDFREVSVYSKETGRQVAHDLPGDLPDELTLTEPGPFDEWDEQTDGWVKDAAAEQVALSEAVNGERERRITVGCTVTVGAKVIPLQGRQQDRDNLQGMQAAAALRIGQGDTTTLVPFRDADNVVHQLTPPEVIALWQGGAEYVKALYEASWDIKDNPPIPADYDDDAHWPAPVWPQPE